MLLLAWGLAWAQEDSLVAHWRFEGSLVDEVSGEEADGVAAYGFGPVGDALWLDEGRTVSFDRVVPEGEYTVMAFFQWQAEGGTMLHCDADATVQVRRSVRGFVGVGAQNHPAQDGRWTHVAVSWDGTSQQVFVNGDAYQTLAPREGETGSCIAGADDLVDGMLMDELRIYDIALDPADVLATVDAWDTDQDRIGDARDNCPEVSNPDQSDRDADGMGDLCDLTPEGNDADGDGVPANLDRCEGDDASGDLDNDRWCADLDCDDRDPQTRPNAVERCDGLDNNCDGERDFDEFDRDGDGWLACEGDCNDDDRFVNPDEDEVCDGVDNDCAWGVDPLFCNLQCAPSGCLCSTAPVPVFGGWMLALLAFASRRRRHG